MDYSWLVKAVGLITFYYFQNIKEIEFDGRRSDGIVDAKVTFETGFTCHYYIMS